MLPLCTKAYITKVDAETEADAFFPNLDSDTDWEITNTSEALTDNGIDFKFVTYERKQ